MERIIRPGPRPFVAAAVVCGLLLILPFTIGVTKPQWAAAAGLAAVFFGIIAMFCLFVSFNRIVVTDEFIATRVGIGLMRRVYFRDIIASVPIVLLESDWPLHLAIYCEEGSPPRMIVLFKPFHKADVTWLLTLPELKIQPLARGLDLGQTQQMIWPDDFQA